jgi:nicotinate-nucleotide adenylyltransferase
MVIGLFFGSFNPLHRAHLKLAEDFFRSAQMDELWWMVSPQNPHKSPEDLAPFHHRLAMLREAIQTPHQRVSDFESFLPAPSYTLDTLRALQQKYPDHQWKILMGQDSWNALPTWKSGDLIESQFEIWVYERPQGEAFRAGRYHLLPSIPMDISSTQIRNQIHGNTEWKPIPEILDCTAAYIAKHQLYQ